MRTRKTWREYRFSIAWAIRKLLGLTLLVAAVVIVGQKANASVISDIYGSLTASEREIVEQVVMAESGAECYDGQRLVAQCIYNACIKERMRADKIVIEYGYTSNRITPSESVKKAVSAVFDEHDTVTDEEVLYFYAPAIVYSGWHESQRFILELGGHRFFA